jgi:N-glycosylase/DNA lyase
MDENTLSPNRVEQVAGAITELGYSGIVKFDETEPEYGFLTSVLDKFESDRHLALLSILAATQDYQLAGDAQKFWQTLEETLLEYGELESESDVNSVLNDFLQKPVNARLREQKQNRLIRMAENEFGEWFLENHPDIDPIQVWEKIADALETEMDRKTVVIGVKIYDIFNLVVNGRYLELPADVPIPCDLQVERVAMASGLTNTEDKSSVMEAWARVMQSVNEELEKPVSMLRIDSIVWQAGQIISKNDDQRSASRHALQEHFDHVGLKEQDSERLARELTVGLEA